MIKHPVSETREMISGEDGTPHNGFRLFTCWYAGGEHCLWVWARDISDARSFALRALDGVFGGMFMDITND